MQAPVEDLADRLASGDVRALARAIRLVEDRDPAAPELVRRFGAGGRAQTVGITGPPGSGKSTLCDLLIEKWRARGLRVGVIAVDPSSPFSGGAILGDRVRMQRHTADPGVFIRSMASRGHLGGLALATREALALLAAAGFDRCLVETVGVGQSELEVMRTADTTVVVTTPASGDAIQLIKAGILEIADVFVVNKADLPGAPKVAKDLRETIHMARYGTHEPTGRHRGSWEPPVVLTTASIGDKVDEVIEAVEAHREYLESSGEGDVRRADRLRAQIEEIVVERVAQHARAALQSATMAEEIQRRPGTVDPYAVADAILAGGTPPPTDAPH